MLLGAARSAVAAEPFETPPPSPVRPATAVTEAAPPERWYGHQTLLADAAALTLLIAGIAVNDRASSRALELGAGAIYLTGGPLVHVAHGRALASLGSLGLRSGVPVLAGLLGSALGRLAPYDDGDEVVRGTVLGVLGGLTAAIALDAALIAWERAPSTPTASTHSAVAWRPCLRLTETRGELGVVGQF
jgi:hypothetical protein